MAVACSTAVRLPQVTHNVVGDFLDIWLTDENGRTTISRHEEHKTYDCLYRIDWGDPHAQVPFSTKTPACRFEYCEMLLGDHCIFGDGEYAIMVSEAENEVVIIDTKGFTVVAKLGKVCHGVWYLVFGDVQVTCIDQTKGRVCGFAPPQWKERQIGVHEDCIGFAFSRDHLATYCNNMVREWNTTSWTATLQNKQVSDVWVPSKGTDGSFFTCRGPKEEPIHQHLNGLPMPPELVKLVAQHSEQQKSLWFPIPGEQMHFFYWVENGVVQWYDEQTGATSSCDSPQSPSLKSICPLGKGHFIIITELDVLVCSRNGVIKRFDRACQGVQFEWRVCKSSCIIAYENFSGSAYQSIQRIEIAD